MALKLGKCRLCLKLGDFYSIFTIDNAIQLSEMVMECARIKVYEGDGLPDKVCSECIQKLSSAYIFKQQCERADQELRRNYVPPPGFSISPPPPNRQSSDSAFSTHTDSSNLKSSFIESKVTPASRARKRSIDSDNGSEASRSRPSGSKRVDELRRSHKRARLDRSPADSDDERDGSPFAPDTDLTDSDEPLRASHQHKCHLCPKTFKWKKSLTYHLNKAHSQVEACPAPAPVPAPASAPSPSPSPALAPTTSADETEKLKCDRCVKTFKLKIMLNRHREICGKTPPEPPRKELIVTLEPIDGAHRNSLKKPVCEYCTATFKTIDNLEKHLRVVHAAVLKRERTIVPCLYCGRQFGEYEPYASHVSACPQTDSRATFQCPVCRKTITRRANYMTHVRNVHFQRAAPLAAPLAAPAHLDRPSTPDDLQSRASAGDETTIAVGPMKCNICDKEFKYRKALLSHRLKHTEDERRVKEEPVEGGDGEDGGETSEDEDEGEADELTCDICEKMFSYRRVLEQHKRTKHNMSSGTKRAKINLKDCSVRCLLCDLEMKVSAINEHNQKHISKNIKPRNIYTCAECEKKFKSCSNLANHIKLVHRLKRRKEHVPAQYIGTSLADFCEVVVTKTEPVDDVQSHNGRDAVPSVQLGGFSCPLCGKTMPTLLSLKRHVNWHTNVGDHIEKKHECFVCKETFRFQCHYKLHMRSHYQDPHLDPALLTCDICGRRSKHLRAALAHMNYHKQTRFQNKDYECSICKRVFQHRRVYLSHMAVHYKRGDSARNTVVGSAAAPAPAPGSAPAAHQCALCGKACDSEVSLKHHTSWHRSKTLLYGARHECALCGVQFTNKRRLELHTRAHYEDDAGPHRCPVCGKGFTDEEYMRRHHKGHNFDHRSHKTRLERLRSGKAKCPLCPRYYPDVAKLVRHLRRTHPESEAVKPDPDAAPAARLSCHICAKVFLDERRLRSHEEAHARKPNFYECKFCGKKTISAKRHTLHVKSHLTAKYTAAPLQCPRCERRFVLGYDLHRHLRAAHGVLETWARERGAAAGARGPLARLQCAVCRKVLASQGNYERHLDYHNSMRCNYCFEHFTSARFLEGHLAFGCARRRLLGDSEPHPRRVKCPVCYKPFHLRVKLECHLRVAHGQRAQRGETRADVAIVCDYCFKAFESEEALASHRVYHRTVGYYGCVYCPRKFNTPAAYRKHKTHHFSQLNVDEPTKCAHCDETFVAFREMIYHMRDAHGDDKEWIVPPKDSVEETCPVCRKRFFNLHRHLEYHEENKCKKCGEYFLSRADFDSHLCEVESEPEAGGGGGDGGAGRADDYEECTFCFKPITKKDSRKKHDILHRTSGAISCRFCELKFKTIDAFNVHAFSHRSRKYARRPIRCRECGERFVRYGPFVRHMRAAHDSRKKMHYRAAVRAERCVVCGGSFPNLHNHYRAHLANRCAACLKYFASSRLFRCHRCDLPDAEPHKVFLSDENLPALIRAYVPRDENDDEKFYGYDDEDAEPEPPPAPDPAPVPAPPVDRRTREERELHMMVTSPIISDVLSLYEAGAGVEAGAGAGAGAGAAERDDDDDDVVAVSDDSLDARELPPPLVVIDSD